MEKPFTTSEVEVLKIELPKITESIEVIFDGEDDFTIYCKNAAQSEIRRSLIYWSSQKSLKKNHENGIIE